MVSHPLTKRFRIITQSSSRMIGVQMLCKCVAHQLDSMRYDANLAKFNAGKGQRKKVLNNIFMKQRW